MIIISITHNSELSHGRAKNSRLCLAALSSLQLGRLNSDRDGSLDSFAFDENLTFSDWYQDQMQGPVCGTQGCTTEAHTPSALWLLLTSRKGQGILF